MLCFHIISGAIINIQIDASTAFPAVCILSHCFHDQSMCLCRLVCQKHTRPLFSTPFSPEYRLVCLLMDGGHVSVMAILNNCLHGAHCGAKCISHHHRPGSFYTNIKKKKRKAYDTRCSQAVTHPSTGRARRCLTSVIGREPVFSAWYGRRQGEVVWLHSYSY